MSQIGNYSISSEFRVDNPMTNQKDEYCLKIMWWSKFRVTVCYCSHDVRPATHLAILNRLWRWGEMHSSQNTHPPCQSAEWLTREWTVTLFLKYLILRDSYFHRKLSCVKINITLESSSSGNYSLHRREENSMKENKKRVSTKRATS